HSAWATLSTSTRAASSAARQRLANARTTCSSSVWKSPAAIARRKPKPSANTISFPGSAACRSDLLELRSDDGQRGNRRRLRAQDARPQRRGLPPVGIEQRLFLRRPPAFRTECQFQR